jgi:putative FmdB family regulatory protein
MPIYEYQCKACNIVSDFIQKMSDEPKITCPECNQDALKKLISAPRFRLAGSGWYETDFKQNGQRNLVSSDNEKSESKIADKKEEKTTESKSDKKTDSASKTKETKSSNPESKSEGKKSKPTKKDGGKAA